MDDIYAIIELVKNYEILHLQIVPDDNARLYIVWDFNPDVCKVIWKKPDGTRGDMYGWHGDIEDVCAIVREAIADEIAILKERGIEPAIKIDEKKKFNFEFGITLKID